MKSMTARMWVGGLLLIVLPGLAQAKGAAQYLKQKDAWFAGAEAKKVAAIMLSWQSDLGGWPKNVSTTEKIYDGTDKAKDLKPTFDNGATTDEMRFLARIYNATKDEKYKAAFLRGLDHILIAQYPNGGWPQFYPPSTQYHRHITFNDNAMVRLLLFLRDIYSQPLYGFVDEARQAKARAEFDKGVQCILKCQIRVGGKLTAWCAQHDEKDFAPAKGRAYELVSLSGAESVGIARFLMSLDKPSPEVIAAVDAAVAWLEAAKITGMRVDLVDDPKAPKGKDKRVVADPQAPPQWARFYEIGTNEPIFCDRDGIAKHKLSEIGYERRNGYSWLGEYAKELLEKEYPEWKKLKAKS